MKKILLLLFAIASLPYFAFSQDYEVKWGNELEGFNRLLRIDNDGFYCFFSEPGKKKTISPFLVKFDNDLNRVFSNEIMVAGEKVYLNNFFALKENFAFITSISDKEKTDYYINLINPEGQSTEAKHMLSKPRETVTVEGIEGEFITFPSEDSTHIIAYYNPGVTGGNYNFKAQKANEVLNFVVISADMHLVYSRNIELPYMETKYRTYDILLSKNNKLVTYSHTSELGNFGLPFSYEKKRGEIIPRLKFIINIFGESPDQDKEIELPQNLYKFYSNFKLKSFNEKIYLIALCTNDPYSVAQGIMICEINTENNSVTPKHYDFPAELVQRINKVNGDKINKKEPDLYYHILRNVHRNSNGNFVVLLERENGLVLENISILELEDPGVVKLSILEKKQNYKNPGNFNSATDFYINDRLIFIYNDHSKNLNSEKLIKYDKGSSHFNIVTSSLSNSGLKKMRITEIGNDGFHFNTRLSRVNNTKLLLVTKKTDKYRLGLMYPKTIN